MPPPRPPDTRTCGETVLSAAVCGHSSPSSRPDGPRLLGSTHPAWALLPVHPCSKTLCSPSGGLPWQERADFLMHLLCGEDPLPSFLITASEPTVPVLPLSQELGDRDGLALLHEPESSDTISVFAEAETLGSQPCPWDISAPRGPSGSPDMLGYGLRSDSWTLLHTESSCQLGLLLDPAFLLSYASDRGSEPLPVSVPLW